MDIWWLWKSYLDGTLNDHGEYSSNGYGYNNQLLQFNPISKEWLNPKSSGNVPPPIKWHSTTAIQHKVWLYSKFGVFDALLELNMTSLVWTYIEFSPLKQQQKFINLMVNGLTDTQLVACSQILSKPRVCDTYTWIPDLPSLTWRQYKPDKAYVCPEQILTIVPWLNNNTIIIGGFRLLDDDDHGEDIEALHTQIFHVRLEPKNLQHLAMQTVFEHKNELALKFLPRKLIKLMEIEAENEMSKKDS